jgi:hypothetical protein
VISTDEVFAPRFWTFHRVVLGRSILDDEGVGDMGHAHDLIAPWPRRLTFVSPRRHAREADAAVRRRRRLIVGAALASALVAVAGSSWVIILSG